MPRLDPPNSASEDLEKVSKSQIKTETKLREAQHPHLSYNGWLTGQFLKHVSPVISD